jgi:phosphoserine phosphatase RsbU/P
MAFLKQQFFYLAVAAVMAGVFWAIGQSINPGTIILYSLGLGNLIMPLMSRVRCKFSRASFPYNWLIFLLGLLIVTPFAYIVSSALVVWIVPPSPQTFWHLVRTGWKFPMLTVVVYAVISRLHADTKESLERRNAELQKSVAISAAQLELQEQEMERAREIQQSLLPKDIPQIAGFDVAAAWQPARMVGGDYFDVLRLGDNRLAVCIADVSGKGVSAALLMANVQATVRAFARETESPARVCSRVNSVLCGNIASGKFVSFFYGILDTTHRRFEYCDAGHPGPIVISRDSIQHLRADGAVLGVFPEWKYEDARIDLKSGDRLLLFTDGITEATDGGGEEFGEEQLAATATASRSNSASALNSSLLARVTDFCSSRFQDDATLLVVAVN